jgi:hypothetical protein
LTGPFPSPSPSCITSTSQGTTTSTAQACPPASHPRRWRRNRGDLGPNSPPRWGIRGSNPIPREWESNRGGADACSRKTHLLDR